MSCKLRGFGPVGILAILVILAGNLITVPLSAILVLVWARWSRTPWREIGYVLPERWVASIALGIVLGVALKFFAKSIVLPLLGADPINHAYHYLVGNSAALPATLFAVTIGAGFGEETVFRGYMFERFGKLFGPGAVAKIFIVLITSALFAAAHYSVQGILGVEQAALNGLTFGTIFAITGRIWMLMVAHAAYDLMAVAIIYFDLEANVAHLIFK
jgi:CAAX protease family protein